MSKKSLILVVSLWNPSQVLLIFYALSIRVLIKTNLYEYDVKLVKFIRRPVNGGFAKHRINIHGGVMEWGFVVLWSGVG